MNLLNALPDLARVKQILSALVSFDTESSKSNLALIDWVVTYLRHHNVDFTLAPNVQGDKAALFATIGPKMDGGIVLSGHTDVVPVIGQNWSSDPFSLRETADRLYGRGTCDMKGFAAICLALVPQMQAASLKKPIHILLSYDEETTCLGPMDIIDRFGSTLPVPGAVIVGEPTSTDVAVAHKSIATYRTRVFGHEAHSAKPFLGANAIQYAAELVVELYKFQDELTKLGDPSGRFDPASSTLSVGTIEGGTARNILARECAFLWEFRGLPATPQRLAYDHFQKVCEKITPRLQRYAPTARIETEIEVEIPGLDASAGSSVESLSLKLARKNQTITVPYATEAGRFYDAGIPTVVCGPGSINQAHQPDEFIAISELESGLRFVRGLISELAS